MKYSELVEIYQKLDSTTKRLDKTYYIAEFLKKINAEELEIVILLLQGLIYPKWDDRKIGVASRLVLKALNIATGVESEKIEKKWKEEGDLGIVAEKLTSKKKQATLFSQDLTVSKVFKNVRALSELEGLGTVDKKVKLIAELLTSAKPNEARYIIRTVLEDMRIGVGEGSIRDSLVWAFFPPIAKVFYKCNNCLKFVPATEKCLNCQEKLDLKQKSWEEKNSLIIEKAEDLEIKELEKYSVIIAPDEKIAREAYNLMVTKVQEALDLTNDFGKVAAILKKNGVSGLDSIELETDKPIKVMLYQKAKSFEDAFERVGKPAAFEYKYDGFRMQIHKKKGEIMLYTRRLENVTPQFPDVVELVKKNINADDYILDAEITGIDPKTKKYLSFQHISQRIKRKYGIIEMSKEIPIIVNFFDAISIENKNLLKTPFNKRREMLQKITHEVTNKLVLAKQVITDNVKEAQKFYEEALKVGNEGVMAKNLEAPYKPGSRVGYGVKIKPTMETLDLVIVGAEWGEGKRSNWLSTFVIACRDSESGELLEIGKVGTGIKEKAEEGTSFEEFTELLKPLIISEKGKEVKVKPQIVIEVNYEEIQKSPTYNSGYALRFPRLLNLRTEKPVDEISTTEMVEELYFAQRGRG